jgi:glycosyltransferase involved in cell wall biosynthesis
MIKNKDFIIFSDDWGRHPFSCQHIMKHFLNDNRILWVNTIGMRNPRLSIYDIKRAVGKLKVWGRPHEYETDIPVNLTVIAPIMIPYNSIDSIRNWNRNSVVRKTREWSERLGFRDPILLATVPNAADYIGHLGESAVVYYCVDEFSEWPGVLEKLTRELETVLLEKADLVACTSDKLAKNKKSPLGPTHLLSHGVDIEHFSKAVAGRAEIEALKDVPNPIIGYFGLFDQRSDQEILIHLLETHPEWSLLVVGRSVTCMERLKQFNNFHHLGPVSYEELPGYAAYFDVCIIPYLVNEFTENINPLKLKEYLATGKPVVSTALPEALNLGQWIQVVHSSGEFVEAVALALESNAEPFVPMAALTGEAWVDKAELLSSWIDKTLARKICND